MHGSKTARADTTKDHRRHRYYRFHFGYLHPHNRKDLVRRMMRLILILLTFSAFGCSHLTIKRGENTPRAIASETDVQIYSWAWGFLPGKKLPAEAELCPSGRIESLTMRMSATDVLISTATLGVFVPHRAEISCSKSATPN